MARKFTSLLLLTACLGLISCSGNDSQGLLKYKNDRAIAVGVVPFSGPLLYQSGGDNVGPDAQLARRIVNRIEESVNLEEGDIRLVWSNRTYQNLTPAVANGEVAFALGAYAITEERKEKVDFSEPYYTSEYVVIFNPNAKEVLANALADLKIGVRQASGAESFVEQQYGGAEVVTFETLDEAIQSLRLAEVDAVLDDRLMARYALATAPGTRSLEILPETLGTAQCGVGVRPGNEALLQLINSVIESMQQEELYAEWLKEHISEEQLEVERRYQRRRQAEQQAQAPRQVVIRISKHPDNNFDIYRFANLRFTLRNNSSGRTYRTSAVSFQGRVGYTSASVPPGSYTMSVPLFNISTKVGVPSTVGGQITVNMRLLADGSLSIG